MNAQRQMGFRENEIRYFSNGEASREASSLNALSPLKRIQRVNQMRTQIDNDETFKVAYRDLVQEGLGKETLIAMNMAERPEFVRNLTNATSIGMKDLKKEISEISGGTQSIKAVADGVNNQLSDFRLSVLGGESSEGVETAANEKRMQFYTEIENSIQTLALYHIRNGMAASTAVEKSTKPFLDQYSFVSTFRVPQEFNAEKIRGFANTFVEAELSKRKLAMYHPDDPRADDLDMKYEQELYVEQIQNHGMWLTSEDESGLVLFNHAGMPVFEEITTNGNKSLQRVYVSFEEAEKDHRQARPEKPKSDLITLKESAEIAEKRRLKASE